MSETIPDRLFTYPYERLSAIWGGTVKIINLLHDTDLRRRYTATVSADREDLSAIVHLVQPGHETGLLVGKCYNVQGSVIYSVNRRVTTIWLDDQETRYPRDGSGECGMFNFGSGMVLSDDAFEYVGVEAGWRIAVFIHQEFELSSLSFVNFEMEYLYNSLILGDTKLVRGDIVTFDATLIAKGPGAQLWLSE